MFPEEKLKQASQLIRAKQYRQARGILETIPDHPKAQEWMSRIDDIMFQQDPFSDVPYTDEEIVAQAGYEPEKPKRPYIVPPSTPQRDYGTLAVITLILYWVFWIPGLIMNLYFLQETRKVKAETGTSPKGTGCLWALLIFYLVLPAMFCLLVIALSSTSPVMEGIFATPTKLLR